MKWTSRREDSYGRYQIVNEEASVRGLFYTESDAARAVADHNLLERFADPEKAMQEMVDICQCVARLDGYALGSTALVTVSLHAKEVLDAIVKGAT